MAIYENLVIAPHIDDEVLGCSSILDENTFVFFCGVDERYSYGKVENRPSKEERMEEALTASNIFGYKYQCGESFVNDYKFLVIKDSLETMVSVCKPEKVFIHCKGFNQDHNTVYDAAMVALRPHDTIPFVKKVLVYESVHDLQWPPRSLDVNYYVPLDIEKKIMGYHAHKSQMRPYRSESFIISLAELRGAAAGVEYAEAFKILRWVE